METQRDEHLVDVWFRLKDHMIERAGEGSSIRPPSLRDAAYAYVLAIRNANETSEETIEAFVNGLELGAISALREAWALRRTMREAADAAGEA
jgi:hypothetical protein